MKKSTSIWSSVALCALSLALSLVAAEFILRMKNSTMKNYDIEMWRYAKELKSPSPNAILDFEHVKAKSARLQNVEIRLNERGLRGGAVITMPHGGKRILFLGSSITLGWGVPEEETVEVRLEKMFEERGKKDVQVLNSGVGNYNSERYVARFFSELTDLHPTDIVVHFFLRDAELLSSGNKNFILRHSQLAVTLWVAYHRIFDAAGEKSLVEHYQNVYKSDAPGLGKMKKALKKLADYAQENGINIYLAMIPDVHNLVDYKLGFVHDLMKKTAEEYGYKYHDLRSTMDGVPPEELWAMPGDPHPNAHGHKLMADAIFPMLN